MAAGAVPCPLNIRLTSVEFSQFLGPVAPSLIVADPEHLGVVSVLGVPVVLLEGVNQVAAIRDRLEPLWSDGPHKTELAETDYALIIPTGGTTGIPKAAVSSHRGMYLWMASNSFNGGRRGRDVELYFSPFFHVSIVSGWMSTLFAGGSVWLLRAFSVEGALDAIDRGATYLSGVATMFTALRRHPDFERLDRSRVRSMRVGSMAITTDFIGQLMADYPHAQLSHSYGATEFGPVSALLHEDFREGRTGVGRALPGCQILVVDEHLRPLPSGEVGELVVSCPWRTIGYFGRDEETAATYTPLGVRLGDLGQMDADGWITISGRRKEMIISGGENIFPNEVEAALIHHPAVREISVYGVKDDYWGERVEAAIVLEQGAKLQIDELNDFGRKSLGGYKLPKAIRIVDAIPLTPANKPDRRRLTQEAEQLQDA